MWDKDIDQPAGDTGAGNDFGDGLGDFTGAASARGDFERVLEGGHCRLSDSRRGSGVAKSCPYCQSRRRRGRWLQILRRY